MSYSVYPIQIDSTNELPTAIDNRTYVRGESVNRLRDAIFNIESELGVKPSTVYGTVSGRLDYIEANMGSGGGGGGGGGWLRSGTTIHLQFPITDTVNFDNGAITATGNPTWNTGAGLFTFGGNLVEFAGSTVNPILTIAQGALVDTASTRLSIVGQHSGNIAAHDGYAGRLCKNNLKQW